MNYTDIKTNESKEFTVKKNIPLSKKVDFTKYVSEMVVSNELGYMLVLKDIFFDYAILQYYTDIQVFEDDSQFNLDELEAFLKRNHAIIGTIKGEIGADEVNFMRNACNELIKFRRMHFGEYKSDIAELLETVRELVVKPDKLDTLLSAVTEWVQNNPIKDLDVDVLTKFANVIPVMNEMNAVEVAKAIIKEHGEVTE